MKKNLIVLALSSTLIFSNYVAAKDQSKTTKKEGIGFTTGLVAGAAVGGPIGAFVGAITGIIIGDSADAHDELASANDALADSKTQLAKLEQEYAHALQLAQQKEQQIEQVQLVSLQTELKEILVPVEANIQFKTASFELEQHYQRQLAAVADSLERHQDAKITLEGFADRRGDESYNHQLSKQRVSAVKQYLIEQGVNESQIQTFAFGENNPVNPEQSLESDFFDRRVKIKIAKANPVLTAANQ